MLWLSIFGWKTDVEVLIQGEGATVFGIGLRRRERRLRQRGIQAMAMVLTTRRKVSGMYKTDDPFYQSAPTQATPSLWEATVRVQPDGERPFDAHLEVWLN